MPTVHGVTLRLDQEALNNSPSLTEQTRAQVSIWGNNPNREMATVNSQTLTPLLTDYVVGSPQYYKKVRAMRKHPTVRLVRVLSIASMSAAKWSVTTTDKAPEGAKDLIETLLPMQAHIMSSGLRGMFDFGWQPFEKVWKYNLEANQIQLRKLKPLLQDQTVIMVESKNGDFAGFKQFQTFIGVSNALLLNQDVEGTYWYGEGTMQAVEFAYNRWLVTDSSNVRYDEKISGAHWVIHYPLGRSTYGGVKMDNHDIANYLLNALQGSGSFVVPRTVENYTVDLNSTVGDDSAWKIEILQGDGAQSSFSQRMQYLDAQIVRAAEFPERSILEGQYGTKADAEAHADFAVARMDFRNKRFIEQINEGLANQMLRINYGESAENSVKIEVAPIADDKKTLLRQVYLGALANPQMAANEYAQIDMQAIRDTIQIPTLQRAGEEDTLPNGGQDYSKLHQMLANLNIDSDVIGSDTGAAAAGSNTQQQLPSQTTGQM